MDSVDEPFHPIAFSHHNFDAVAHDAARSIYSIASEIEANKNSSIEFLVLRAP